MNLKFWDKKARLVAAFSDLTVDEAQEIIKKAKKGYTLSKIGKRARKGALDDYAKVKKQPPNLTAGEFNRSE